jgi:hypothetical protein
MSSIDGVSFSNIQYATERFGTDAKVGSVKLPNFNKLGMHTKTEPSRSDEELKEAIVKIAREDAKKGQLQNQTKEFLDLRKEFMSSVSPDRENIITNSTKQIFSNKKTKGMQKHYWNCLWIKKAIIKLKLLT